MEPLSLCVCLCIFHKDNPSNSVLSCQCIVSVSFPTTLYLNRDFQYIVGVSFLTTLCISHQSTVFTFTLAPFCVHATLCTCWSPLSSVQPLFSQATSKDLICYAGPALCFFHVCVVLCISTHGFLCYSNLLFLFSVVIMVFCYFRVMLMTLPNIHCFRSNSSWSYQFRLQSNLLQGMLAFFSRILYFTLHRVTYWYGLFLNVGLIFLLLLFAWVLYIQVEHGFPHAPTWEEVLDNKYESNLSFLSHVIGPGLISH